jgi:hypothetical protein
VQKSNAATPRPDTTPQLIELAISLVGDRTNVMEQMRCSEADFLLYCSGEKELPFAELDRLVAVIVDEQKRKIAEQHERLRAFRANQERFSSDFRRSPPTSTPD